MKIYYWADGCWCHEHELTDMNHKSDDVGVLYLDDATSEEQVDEIVRGRVS